MARAGQSVALVESSAEMIGDLPPVSKAYRAFGEAGQATEDTIDQLLQALGREVASLCIRRVSG